MKYLQIKNQLANRGINFIEDKVIKNYTSKVNRFYSGQLNLTHKNDLIVEMIIINKK